MLTTCKARLFSLLLLITSSSAVQAQPILTWGTGGTGGTGSWDNITPNWFDGLSNVAWANGSAAQFSDTAGTVTVSSATLSTQSITFSHSTGSYVLLQTGANALTLAGTGIVTQNNATDAVRIGAWVTASVGVPVITGTAGFTKSGAGEVILASQLNTTGGITINQGILTFGDRTQPTASVVNSAIGTSIANGNSITINNGGTLRIAASAATGTNFSSSAIPQVTLNGDTTIAGWRTGTSASHSPVINGNLVVGASGATLNFVAQGNSSTTAVGNNRLSILGTTTLNGNFTVRTQPFISGTSVSNASFGAITDNGNAMTFLGGGSATTLPGDSIRLTAASTVTGNWTIGNSGGTEGVSLSLSTVAPAALTSGTITVNPYGALWFFNAGSWGTIGQNINLNGIGASLADFSAGTSGAIRAGAVGTTSIASNIVLQSDSVINPTAAATVLQLNGAVSGAFTLQKQGLGTLQLSASNPGWTGGTTVGNGTVNVDAASNIGAGALTMASTGAVTPSNTTLNLNNATQSVGNLASTFAATSGTAAQTINLNGTALTINQTANTTYGTGAVGTLTSTLAGTGSVSLSNTSTGILTLTGANTYSGTTTINGGTLRVNGSHAGAGAYTVNTTGTLGGSGVITGNVTIAGGILAPGNSPGTLTINGNVDFSATSTFAVEINGATTAGTDYDQLAVGASGSLILNSAVLSVALGYAPSPADQIYLTDNAFAGAISGTFAGLPVDGGSITIGAYTGIISYSGDFATNGLLGTGNDIVIYGLMTAVPEPGSIAMMALLGFGAIQWYRYRQPKTAVKTEETPSQEAEATPV